MNAFNQARQVEAVAMADLIPFIRDRAFEGQLVITDKGNLSKALQKEFGDLLFNCKAQKHIWAVEVKAETQDLHGNLFLETWSNRERFTPGWMFNLRTDLLFYYFVASKELYIAPFDRLRRWCFHSGAFDGIYKYPERCQSKYTQLNDTWGRCVPIRILTAAVGMKRFVLGEATIVSASPAPSSDSFSEMLFQGVK